jgi:hypothetical protein
VFRYTPYSILDQQENKPVKGHPIQLISY